MRHTWVGACILQARRMQEGTLHLVILNGVLLHPRAFLLGIFFASRHMCISISLVEYRTNRPARRLRNEKRSNDDMTAYGMRFLGNYLLGVCSRPVHARKGNRIHAIKTCLVSLYKCLLRRGTDVRGGSRENLGLSSKQHLHPSISRQHYPSITVVLACQGPSSGQSNTKQTTRLGRRDWGSKQSEPVFPLPQPLHYYYYYRYDDR
ncbi:hypothetical protein LY78DRAFT_93352 [Colletotrichum sublineola]|nr:hypothetical protein LY78DRAFT_93352 [Colletotrichum sublineola]